MTMPPPTLDAFDLLLGDFFTGGKLMNTHELDKANHALGLIAEVCDIAGIVSDELLWRRVQLLASSYFRQLPKSEEREALRAKLEEFRLRNNLFSGAKVATLTEGQGYIVGVDGEEFCVRLDDSGERPWFARHQLRLVIDDEEASPA